MKDGHKKAPLLVTGAMVVVATSSIFSGYLFQRLFSLAAEHKYVDVSTTVHAVLNKLAFTLGAYATFKFGWIRLFGGWAGVSRALMAGVTPRLAYDAQMKSKLAREGKVAKSFVAISDTHSKHKWLKMPWVL